MHWNCARVSRSTHHMGCFILHTMGELTMAILPQRLILVKTSGTSPSGRATRVRPNTILLSKTRVICLFYRTQRPTPTCFKSLVVKHQYFRQPCAGFTRYLQGEYIFKKFGGGGGGGGLKGRGGGNLRQGVTRLHAVLI